MDSAVAEVVGRGNPAVFFDVAIAGTTCKLRTGTLADWLAAETIDLAMRGD